jgi:5-formyltetrahydrofolate cyclo-ligase
MTDPVALKAELRRAARQRRADAAAAAPNAAQAIMRLLLDSPIIPDRAVIAGYVPVRDEIDPMPLLEALAQTHICALPSVDAGRALTFRQWRPRMALVPERYGISAPPLDAPSILPDIVLVPLLAFDRLGHRLGYGGGHYDATLAELRTARPVKAVGLAYAAQQIDRIPAETWDQALDYIVTELELMKFGSETPG